MIFCFVYLFCIINCFYVTNIPDIANRPLRSQIYSAFGYCGIDFFHPKYGRNGFNSGSCKIFLPHDVAKKHGLFDLKPFEFIDYKMGFENDVCISRWVKNDYSLRVTDIYGLKCCENYEKIEFEDCKSEEFINCDQNETTKIKNHSSGT